MLNGLLEIKFYIMEASKTIKQILIIAYLDFIAADILFESMLNWTLLAIHEKV